LTRLIVTRPSPHLGAQACPSTPKVLRTREYTSSPYPSVVFTFGLTTESIKELVGASLMGTFLNNRHGKNG